jgi:hypothetical protein
MSHNEKLKQQINHHQIQEKKWKGRRSKYWFLLPTGANGLFSVIFTLDKLDITALNTGAWIASVFSLVLIILGSILYLVPLIKARMARRHINDALSKLSTD